MSDKDYATKQEVKDIVRDATEEIVGVIQGFMLQVDGRFNKMESRMDEFDTKLDKLTVTLDRFASRIENTEVEQAASDARFEKLLSWAKDVSERTGIPLKDL